MNKGKLQLQLHQQHSSHRFGCFICSFRGRREAFHAAPTAGAEARDDCSQGRERDFDSEATTKARTVEGEKNFNILRHAWRSREGKRGTSSRSSSTRAQDAGLQREYFTQDTLPPPPPSSLGSPLLSSQSRGGAEWDTKGLLVKEISSISLSLSLWLFPSLFCVTVLASFTQERLAKFLLPLIVSLPVFLAIAAAAADRETR